MWRCGFRVDDDRVEDGFDPVAFADDPGLDYTGNTAKKRFASGVTSYGLEPGDDRRVDADRERLLACLATVCHGLSTIRTGKLRCNRG